MFFIKTFDSKISWNINKIYFKTFSHSFQISFISNVIQTISYQISNQTLSYQIQNQIHFKYIFLWSSNIKWCPVTFISNPKSNTFQIYFSLVITYQMVPSYVGLSNGWLAANCSFQGGRNQTLLVLVTSNQTPRGWGSNQLHSLPRKCKGQLLYPVDKGRIMSTIISR